MPTWKCNVMSREHVNAMEDRHVRENEKVTAMDQNQENAHHPKAPEIDDRLSLIEKAPNLKAPNMDVEEFNFCPTITSQDGLFAECIPTVTVDAQQWLHMLSVELERTKEMRVDTFVPATRKPNVRTNRNEAPMVDIYGYRDIDSTPFALLSPFEFIRYWDAEPLQPPSWYRDGESKTKWTPE